MTRVLIAYESGGQGLAYYNENDPFAAATLRELIAEGVIAPGFVDERDIRDVRPDELSGFTQHHFFAGGGIWSYALRRAGWPDWLPVWTCSCPCQPFSAAGKGIGFADERHLWPAFYWLKSQLRPVVVLGEQVTGGDADAWLDLVQADVEALGYAFGCVPLASAGFGAPNPRHRAFWVAYAAGVRWEGFGRTGQDGASQYRDADGLGNAMRDGARPIGGNGDCAKSEAIGIDRHLSRTSIAARDAGAVGRVADTAGIGYQRPGLARHRGHGPSHDRDPIRLANTLRAGLQVGQRNAIGRGALRDKGQAPSEGGISSGLAERPSRGDVLNPGPVNGFWHGADWLLCRDPKGPRWRPVDSGTFPLAPGNPARVGTLRLSGNAINAEVATGFIQAVMGTLETERLAA